MWDIVENLAPNMWFSSLEGGQFKVVIEIYPRLAFVGTVSKILGF